MRSWMLLLAATAAASGCVTQSCTLMYSPSSLQVEFDPGLSDVGEYRVELDGVGCTLAIPYDEAAPPVCDDFAYIDWDDTAVLGIRLEEQVEDAMELRVLLDGTEVHAETIEPDYDEDEPNGEGCGVRRSAVVVVSVP